MAFQFENLKVWQKALVHCNEIDLMVKSFPRDELFSLSSQVKRAADSVVLNIAEGSTGQSIPEYKRFLGIALRSAVEVVACLFIAHTRNYIDATLFKKHYESYEILCKMITKLRDSMKLGKNQLQVKNVNLIRFTLYDNKKLSGAKTL